MKYLKQFIIGSCAFISLPNYYSIYNNPATFHHKDRELKYYNMTIETPIRIGLWNVGSLILAESFNLSPPIRFFITTLLHWLATIVYVKYHNLYNYTEYGWNRYYFRLLIFYTIMWNVVIYNLERLI